MKERKRLAEQSYPPRYASVAVFVFSLKGRGACRGAPPSVFLQSSLPWGGGAPLQGLIRRRERRVAHSSHSGLVVSITPRRGDALFSREGRRWEERKGKERGGLQPHRGQTAVRSWDAKTQRSSGERVKKKCVSEASHSSGSWSGCV